MNDLVEALKGLAAGKEEIIYMPLEELLTILKCHKVFGLDDFAKAFSEVSLTDTIGEYAYLKDVLWELNEQ